jgi:Zn-dependent M28 family amino/carboxypeptidase
MKDIRMEFLEKNLEEHVRTLSVEIGERDMDSHENLRVAGEYIVRVFKKYNYSVESQDYGFGGRAFRNIIASQPGRHFSREVILVGAHYDTVPGSPGADDNASGVAGMLELAKIFSGHRTDRTLKFVAFCNEENGLVGSQVYARRAKEHGETIVAMFSLEMIGYYTDRALLQRYPPGLRHFYPNAGNFIAVVGHLRWFNLVRKVKAALMKNCSVPVQSLAGVGFIRGVEFSDHASFWREGYPAVMITDTAFYRNPNYHLPTDTLETLDYRRMAEVVKGLYHTVLSLDR